MMNSGKESSDSDMEDLNWSLKKRKQNIKSCDKVKREPISEKSKESETQQITEKNQKFEELKKKSESIKLQSARRLHIAENRRSKKLVKKALKDPFIRELVHKNQNTAESELSTDKNEKEWKEVKPFLTVNSHLQGPISHGDFGPKTEMECIIEGAIKEGDFEKAELLSDTLANKEFAGKICKAFAAKRCHEQLEKQKVIEKAQQMKKIRWTFGAKERWEMKGNM